MREFTIKCSSLVSQKIAPAGLVGIITGGMAVYIVADEKEIQRPMSASGYSKALATMDRTVEVCSAHRYARDAAAGFSRYLDIFVDELEGSGTRVQIAGEGTIARVKNKEAEESLKRGASGLDLVIDIPAFKLGHYQRVANGYRPDHG
jgi:hypothetical protein